MAQQRSVGIIDGQEFLGEACKTISPRLDLHRILRRFVSEPAVVVAFVESGLDAHWPDWTDAAPEDLAEGARAHDVTRYTFPESRLSTLSDKEAATLRADTTLDMGALRARLADADWDIDQADDGSLLVEKMDEQYRISPTGTVEGEGQIREPLENIVDQYSE